MLYKSQRNLDLEDVDDASFDVSVETSDDIDPSQKKESSAPADRSKESAAVRGSKWAVYLVIGLAAIGTAIATNLLPGGARGYLV